MADRPAAGLAPLALALPSPPMLESPDSAPLAAPLRPVDPTIDWVAAAAGSWLPPLLAATALGCCLWRLRAREPANRGFVGFLAVYFATWVAAPLLAGWVPVGGVAGSAAALAATTLLVDSLRFAGFLSLLFAIDARPDAPGGTGSRRGGDPLELWGAVAFFFALLVYFVHIPSLLNPLEYLAARSALLLELGLDAYFALRFARLAAGARGGSWHPVYRLLTLAFLCHLGRDVVLALGVWTRIGATLAPLAAVGYLAFLLAAGAVLAVPRTSRSSAEERAPEDLPLPTLVLYAAALPILHLLLYPLARQIPASYGAREVLTLVYVVAVGGLAAVQVRRRERERRDAVERLRDSERRYRALVDGHPDALAVEQDGRIVFRNAAFDALPPPFPGLSSLAAVGLAAPAGEATVRAERRIPLPRQRRGLHLDVTQQPIRWQGAPAWQVTLRDMTRLDALRRRTRRMKRLAQLGELAGSLADELRAPLADLGRRSLALAGRLAADDVQTRDDLALAVERMERIVAGMERFSQPPVPRLEAVDPGELLHTALRQLADRLDGRTVNLLIDFRHGEETLQVDRHQMLQVFVNLLDNAVSAISGSGEVALRTLAGDGGVEVVVEDSGRGIAAADLDRIFDPFFTTGDGGTGLGLAVVARILERHGCRHEVESEPGVGTRFRIHFPRADEVTG